MTTGYNVREGSLILAARRAERERDEQVAKAMLRDARIRSFVRKVLIPRRAA